MKKENYFDKYFRKQSLCELKDRSDKIIEYFKKYVDKKDSILELGCSSGRNLVALQEAGYKDVIGLEMSLEINPPENVNIIHGRWEDFEMKPVDVVFSASFLQEFEEFPQLLFENALQSTRKYFIIFGDYLREWKLPTGWEIIEQTRADYPFSQPIIVCKNTNN